MSKIIDLAKKLHAMAERGENHERENAADKLEKLMQKYGITFDDIEIDQARDFVIEYKGIDKKFVVQIIANVLGKKARLYDYGHPKTKKFIIRCTHSEFLLIQAKLDFFWPAYNDELDIFYGAFIQKNRLFAKPDKDNNSDEKQLSPEEFERVQRIILMSQNIKSFHMQKHLAASNQ